MRIVHQTEMGAGLRGRSSGRQVQAANISGYTPRSPTLASSHEVEGQKPLEQSSRARHWIVRGIPLAVLGLAIWAAYHELRTYRLTDITGSLSSFPPDTLIAAIALTTLGHLVHVGYDVLALRYAKHPLPWRRTVFGSLITYSVSAVTGFTGMIGASLRYRFWSAWGVSTSQIVRGISFAALTAGLGASVTAAAALTWDPAALSLASGVPAGALRVIGVALSAVTAAYLVACATIRGPLTLRRVCLALPAPGLGLLQVVVAALDWTIAAGVFFVLLPSSSSLGFMSFLAIFLAAQVSGLLAHVPAGIGVFDAAILWLLRPFIAPPEAAAALIAYRAVAYLLPFLVALPALGGYEARQGNAPLLRL